MWDFTSSWRQLLVSAVTIVVMQSACGGDTPTGPSTATTASVQVTGPGDPLPAIGVTAQFSAVAKDSDGGTLAEKTAVWSSSKPSVATVDSDGLVTAMGNGTAEIRAAVDGVSGSAPIQVAQAVAAVTIVPSEDSLAALEDTLPVEATAVDAGGNPITDAQFLWRSSDETVALVSAETSPGQPNSIALVVSVAEGTALISAEIDDLQATTEITVRQTAAEILMAPDTVFITAGDMAQLSAVAVDAQGNEMPGVSIDWSVSDESLATIDTEGLLSVSTQAAPGASLNVEASGDGAVGSAPIHLVLEFQSVTGGQNHSCGLTSDGTAYCWGRNYWGMLGDGSNNDRPLPEPVAGGHVFESLSAGSWHTCGIAVSGGTYCWGRNLRGTLGDGTEVDRTTPVEVIGGHTFQSVAPGNLHTCALTTDGAAYCWGDGEWGQRGDSTAIGFDSIAYEPVPVAGGHTFVTISAGRVHTCAIDDIGEAYCWGHNQESQLGRDDVGFLGTLSYPWAVDGGHEFTLIKTKRDHTCALTPMDTAYCWGENRAGQVGDGSTGGERDTPTLVTGGHSFTALHVGTSHTCGLQTDGRAYCWGEGAALGDGSGTPTGAPVPVAGDRVFVEIDGGTHTTFAIDPSERTFGWGSDSYGATGTGALVADTPSPVRY